MSASAEELGRTGGLCNMFEKCHVTRSLYPEPRPAATTSQHPILSPYNPSLSKMSFGFSVGDFISVASLAWNIYSSCKNSPAEFNNISNEVASLSVVLDTTAVHILQHGIDQSSEAELGLLETGCRTVLRDIQRLLRQYDHLGARRRNLWQRVRWSSEDISGIRSRLTSNVTLLTAFNSTLTKCVLLLSLI
jgi:hypothetical protein